MPLFHEMSAEDIEAAIERRRREIEQQPCYRCGHKPVAPQRDCECCQNAHTPKADGTF